VEKQPTSKDEEANVDAEQLIEAISLETPIFPSSLADIIALGDATRSTAWGAISIKIEDVELLMKVGCLSTNSSDKKHGPTMMMSNTSYT